MVDLPEYLKPGVVLAGKYRVEGVLGSGGMGFVLAARHVHLQERVALKFLRADASTHAPAVARFLREARAAARIKNEHVVRVTDFGTLDGGVPYLVMEYLEGRDLASELESSGRMPLARAADVLLQACEALAEAHALGIVHRDLKPANLFLCRPHAATPWLKLLDFGISKLPAAAEDPSVTTTHGLLGSPLYMSPEQLRRPRDVDARSDIWSLGAVLFELATGEPPFRGQTVSDLCVKIATEPPRELTELLPDAPPRLEAIVYRCLEKAPQSRYPDIQSFAQDLAELGTAEGRGSLARITSSRASGIVDARAALDEPVEGREQSSDPASAAQTLTAQTENVPAPDLAPALRPSRSRRGMIATVTGLAALAAASSWTALRFARGASSAPTPHPAPLGVERSPVAVPTAGTASDEAHAVDDTAGMRADATPPKAPSASAQARANWATAKPRPASAPAHASSLPTASGQPAPKPTAPAAPVVGGGVFDSRKL